MTLVPDKPSGLARELTWRDGTAIVAGTMIGSGIFLVPSAIAGQVSSLTMATLVWVAGALLSLAGVFTISELGAMFPEAGGIYVYLREAYGKPLAFLYGWASLVAIDSGAIAALAVAFGIYLGQLVWLTPAEMKVAGVFCILLLSTVNCLGVKFGKHVQNVFVVCKVGGLALMSIFLLAHTNAVQLRANVWPQSGHASVSSFGIALIAALWAYFGWHESSYNAAEFKNPQRDFPRALLLGSLLVSLAYVLANFSYYAVLSYQQIAESNRVAATALGSVMGPGAASALAVLIIISVFGGTNGMIISGPRLPYVMAKDNLFFAAAARTNPRTQTPIVAILMQAGWAIALSLVGTFQQLITYCVFTVCIFFALSAAAVIKLRKTRPEHPRPFRTPAYPWLPILFAAANVGLVVNTYIADPKGSTIGLAFVLMGWPVYLLIRLRNQKPAAVPRVALSSQEEG